MKVIGPILKLLSAYSLALCIASSVIAGTAQSPRPDPVEKKSDGKAGDEKRELTTDQKHAFWLLMLLKDELKSEVDKPAAALLMARIADALWKHDEQAARNIFQTAFDSIRRPLSDETLGKRRAEPSKPDDQRAEILSLRRRQASALLNVLRRFGARDREAADALTKLLDEDKRFRPERDQDSRMPGYSAEDRAEHLAYVALELAESRPREAYSLGLQSMSSGLVSPGIGPLLFALKNQDSKLSDALFRAALTTLAKSGRGYSPALVSLSNYLFDWQGRPRGDSARSDVMLMLDFSAEATNALLQRSRESSLSGQPPMSDSDARLYGYLSSRGLSIIRYNAPERLLVMEQSLAELYPGLNPQQRQSASALVSLHQQTVTVMNGLKLDDESQLSNADSEKDPWVRDTLLRNLALTVMHGDSGRARYIAEKIGSAGLRSQTEDDITLFSLSDKVSSKSYESARQTALKINDFSLRARVLAQMAGLAAKDMNRAGEALDLLSEAYSIASKGEDTPDKLAALLIITEKFAGMDAFRGFDALADTVKILNRISERPVSLSSFLDRSPVTIEFTTKISDKEMTAGENITLESLDFHEVEALARHDYTRTRMLGENIENKVLRAKYLIAVASNVLNHPSRARTETTPSK